MLVTHHIDQLELLEKRSNGVEALAHLRPRLNRDAQRQRVVEDEAQECVPNRPYAPVGDIEIDACEMRQRDLALLVAHREIVAGAVCEIADARDANAVAVDERARHHRHFWPPGPIMRWRNKYPPRDHAEIERNQDRGHAPAPPTRQPDGPDREGSKSDRHRQAQSGPRQVRIVDGQRGPGDEDDLAEKPDCRPYPASGSAQHPANWEISHSSRSTHWTSLARSCVNSWSLIDPDFFSRSSFSISSATLKPTTLRSSSRACCACWLLRSAMPLDWVIM